MSDCSGASVKRRLGLAMSRNTLNNKHPVPVALTIAGSDSGGGAGIQADLKTFAALGVFGTSAITCITAQNPAGIVHWHPLRATLVRQQVEAVLDELPVKAAKTGMLGNRGIVDTVASIMADHRDVAWIVDPVLRASSGRAVASKAAIRNLQDKLLPLAALVTPNLPEAEQFSGCRIQNLDDMKGVAEELSFRWGVPCLLKGGHLGGSVVTDILCLDGRLVEFKGPRIGRDDLHGTGCTLSAAITAWLAKGDDLVPAIRKARLYLRRAIEDSVRIGRFRALGWPDA